MDKRKITVQILNAFADNDQGGNPAGVVLNADKLSKEDKLDIAKKVGLSETAFVSRSQTADYKLDFFTPTKQIAHCGHATIATFSYLRQMGALKEGHSSKETIDGNRKIMLTEELAFMEQTAPTYTEVKYREKAILKSLGLDKNQLASNLPINVVNTGNSFLIVPVKSRTVLKNLKLDLNLIQEISEEFDLIGYYVFTDETEDAALDATTRMFGPRYGILEESGTGMAAGPLACYLYDIVKLKKEDFKIQQGVFMKEPSKSLITVHLKVEQGRIQGLMAGGKGILMGTKTLELP